MTLIYVTDVVYKKSNELEGLEHLFWQRKNCIKEFFMKDIALGLYLKV